MGEPILKTAEIVCIYVSLPEEVATHELLVAFGRQKKTIVVPHIVGKTITLCTFSSLNNLTAGMFGILEPRGDALLVPSDMVDVFIVPGVAFDRKGYRLGWGRGYYDRLLKDITVPRIGLAYSCQIVPGLPHEMYDIQMNVIITQNETIEV
ncbi:5-formyltetrahydrofolate cyclo-ligase [Candidatus Gottesmanbacteria bacterium RBG_13_45_10]|uniref:5-formyltetrahydrofolate cyclo-ligase n=1 Tax=Candidatus Gottesmanbacteria bacterium RBG_13_45_10 TaxID=1798370 RepID=A0A1F5ZFZ3_9BACT|nr:MAG: 5-formyltetrahydrofolate cyclo-ligase [Candidatus Gottesmanbacteria bacterium RBG_13_45_10]